MTSLFNNKKSCFIIAEAGVNHNGDITLAKKLIDKALEAQVDAVKFQTFTAEDLVTPCAESADYQKKNTGGISKQFEMLKKLELSYQDFSELKNYSDKKGILFLSSPFDEKSADFLALELKMDIIKIPSGEITNLPFLSHIAGFKKPIILSTGMSTMDEIDIAVKTIENINPQVDLSLLHCTSNYPCPFEEVNLKAMLTIKNKFQKPVGYSDHTMGIEISVAAVSLGASIIEKHFTLDPNMQGPDHRCSLSPVELQNLVSSIRNVEKSLGDGIKKPFESELAIRQKVRKSLVFTKDLKAGHQICKTDLTAKRPGDGISPGHIASFVGKRLKVNKQKNDSLTSNDIHE